MKKLNHLAEIQENYDTYIIDLWGVIHNGVRVNPKAIEAVENLILNKRKVIFLTNYTFDHLNYSCKNRKLCKVLIQSSRFVPADPV